MAQIQGDRDSSSRKKALENTVTSTDPKSVFYKEPVLTPSIKQPSATALAGYSPVNAPQTTAPVISNNMVQETKLQDSATKGVGSVIPGQEQDTVAPVNDRQPTANTGEMKTFQSADTSSFATTGTGSQEYKDQQAEFTGAIDKLMATPNVSLDKLNALPAFDYNPQTDPAYLRDAAGLENQIANIMVGRGMLFSSIANSAIQSALMNLQISKTAEKRQAYVEDRNFLLNMAQNEMQQKNTSFNQIMELKQDNTETAKNEFNQAYTLYKAQADAEQVKFDQMLKERAYTDAREDEAFRRDQIRQQTIAAQTEAKLKIETAQAMQNLTASYQGYKVQKNKYNELIARWEKTGKSDMETLLFFRGFGVTVPIGTSNADSASRKIIIESMLLQKENELKENAMALNQFEEMNTLLYGKPADNKGDTTVIEYDKNGEIVSKRVTSTGGVGGTAPNQSTNTNSNW